MTEKRPEDGQRHFPELPIERGARPETKTDIGIIPLTPLPVVSHPGIFGFPERLGFRPLPAGKGLRIGERGFREEQQRGFHPFPENFKEAFQERTRVFRLGIAPYTVAPEKEARFWEVSVVDEMPQEVIDPDPQMI